MEIGRRRVIGDEVEKQGPEHRDFSAVLSNLFFPHVGESYQFEHEQQCFTITSFQHFDLF